jgi:hypothetical protein
MNLDYMNELGQDEVFNGLSLSEDVLRRDWDTPTEDAVWSDL